MLDLERFPTSEAAKRMLGTVSPIYDRAYVAKWLYQVLGSEIDEAWQFFNELRRQAYPETTTWGIGYWEQQQDLPSDEALTLTERRRRVLVNYGTRAPLNPAIMEQIARNITGRVVSMIERAAEYGFTLEIAPGESMVDYNELLGAVRRMKPSHLSARIMFRVDVTVRVRIHEHEKYAFPYVLAGKAPETNTAGALTDSRIILDSDITSSLFPYQLSGLGNTGEHPETNTAGDIEQRSIVTSISITGSLYQYPLCGETEKLL